MLWEGAFEGIHDRWLRWCDRNGRPIPTGAERAAQLAEKADRLAEKLRSLGINPDEF